MSSIAEAVFAAVQAAVPGRQVWDGIVPAQPDPTGHVVVFCPEGSLQLENLGGQVDGRDVAVIVQSFGPTRQAAGWLSRHVSEYLAGSGVTVAGWGHGDVSEHFNRSPTPDEDVKEFPTVMFYDEFHMLFAKDA